MLDHKFSIENFLCRFVSFLFLLSFSLCLANKWPLKKREGERERERRAARFFWKRDEIKVAFHGPRPFVPSEIFVATRWLHQP